MQQNKLIIFISALFVLSASYLFYVSDRSLRSDAGKTWWAIYFDDPKSDSLNFAIENHSNQNNFHWEIRADNQKISEGDVEIKTGESKNIRPDVNTASGKNFVVISSGNEKKEIYKQR